MTWTQISDDWPDALDTLELDRSTRLLHLEALVWCNRRGTDGYVPRSSLARVTDHPDIEQAVGELVKVGWWNEAEKGWTLVRLQGDQMPAAEVEQRRETARVRQIRQRKHKAGDHAECDSRYCRGASRVTERVTDSVSHDSPAHPSPVHKDWARDGGAEGASASATAPVAPKVIKRPGGGITIEVGP